ncbi:MAG: type III pantothenate kinase [Clostridia bacterium]|nr:type III pantothenate kinase [Clostridia bacterium]
MIFALHVGNSLTRFAFLDGDSIVERQFEIPTAEIETAESLAARIDQVLKLFSLNPAFAEGAVVSSVVPFMAPTAKQAVQMLVGKEPLLVGAGVKTGLHILIDDPGTVASDLVATAVGAKTEYPLPCIVIVFGTATTMTVVDEKGRFVGGAILPGVSLGLSALSSEASLLPQVEIKAPKKVISTSTAECMRSGTLYGSAGAVDGLLNRFEEEIGREPATIVATGKLAKTVCEHCTHSILLDDNLLLKGLYAIYKKNQK